MSNALEDVKAAFAAPENINPDVAASPPAKTKGNKTPLFAEGSKLPLNDTGNGQRFALYFSDMTMFVPRLGWFFWDGCRWKVDDDGINVRRFAQQVQNKILEEIPYLNPQPWDLELLSQEDDLLSEFAALSAAKEDQTTKDKTRLEKIEESLSKIKTLKASQVRKTRAWKSFSKKSGDTTRVGNTMTEATTCLDYSMEVLDANPLSVNTQSGVLQFSVTKAGDYEGISPVASMELVPHARKLKFKDGYECLTKLMPVEYDPKATCPVFDAFLERIQPDKDVRDFLQRWCGLSMTALPVQQFVFQYGGGNNGKSVLADIMTRILGDYAVTLKIESITGRNRRDGASATPDLVGLVGARYVRAAEPEEGERLQEAMIKELTGGEPILLRNLHGNCFEYRPYFKLGISGNHKLEIRGTDDGIWRRVLFVPFDVQIPKKDRDGDLINKLYAERSGILNWLIAGLIDVLEGGLQEPEKVLAATSEYRTDSDPIGQFLTECCDVTGDSQDFTESRDLIDGFSLWQDQRGDGVWGKRAVSLKFKNNSNRYRDPITGRNFTPTKRAYSGYGGIKFKPAFQSAYENAPRNAQGRPLARALPSTTDANSSIWGPEL